MNLFPHIKKNIISFTKNGKTAIIFFLIFPMILAYIYGSMQQDLFDGKSNFNPISVEFKYDETSKEGEILSGILKENDVKRFICNDYNEEPKCIVTISEDFKTIDIKKLKGSDYEIDMVKNFIKAFCENINIYSTVLGNIENLNLSPKYKQDLTIKIINKLSENNKVSPIESKIVPGYRGLGSREYYTISMFSFTAIMLIMILTKEYYKGRKDGVVRRYFSTPNSKESYLMGYLVSSLLIALFINFIYITLNRVLGIAFTENYILNLLLGIVQSILEVSVVGAIISFIKSEQVANSLMIVLTIISVIIGGVFFNADFFEIKVLKIVSNFAPNSLILNSYKNLFITQTISGAGKDIVISLLLSSILFVLSFIKIKQGWEE